MDGIDYKPNGEIVVSFDDTTYRLRRPKLREYRWLSERLTELRAETTKISDKIDELRAARLTENPDEERIEHDIANLNKPIYEYLGPLVRDIVVKVGDKPLPDDMDDWPPWLAMDPLLPAEILAHWRTVPKAPGAAGTN